MDIKKFIEEVKKLAIMGQEVCNNYDATRNYLEGIEDLCDQFEKEN